MTREAALSSLLDAAERLHKSVRMDECGEMQAGQYVNGNGGLLSIESMILNEQFGRELDNWKRWYAGSGDKPTGTGMEGS